MAGDIYIGYDLSQPSGKQSNDGYVSSLSFLAFGNLLNEILATSYPLQLVSIKEGEAMMLYSFCGLSARDYNDVIRVIRNYIINLKNPTDGQKKGISVWQEIAESFVRKDQRYDFLFHGEKSGSLV
jgi:hypothetical protein